MNKEFPYFQKIKIFEVDKLPTLEEFMKNYYIENKNFAGFFIFELDENINPEEKKRFVIYVTSPEINSPIYKLCFEYCKNNHNKETLIPYLIT